MLTLAILLCFVAFVTAFMPVLDIVQKTAQRAENSLNKTELRFDEELAHSFKKANEVIMNIPDNTDYFREIIIHDTIYIVNKVDVYVIGPARQSGLNTTECDQLSSNFVQAANNLTAKKTFCVDKIVKLANRYMNRIQQLANYVHGNFDTWRDRIHNVTSTAVDSESTTLAYTMLESTVDNAEVQLNNNYLHRLKLKITRIEELGTERASENCFRATEEYSTYERKYWSLPEASKKCTNAAVQMVDIFKSIEITN